MWLLYYVGRLKVTFKCGTCVFIKTIPTRVKKITYIYSVSTEINLKKDIQEEYIYIDRRYIRQIHECSTIGNMRTTY